MFEKFTKSARGAVSTAMEEAIAARSTQVDPRHLVLGILGGDETTARTVLEDAGLDAAAVRADLRGDGPAGEMELGAEDAEALKLIGIDLDAVRESLGHALDPRPAGRRGGRPSFGRDAKKVLELALREAVYRRDGAITAEHLLMGVLRGGESRTLRLIEQRVPARELRHRLEDSMGEAA